MFLVGGPRRSAPATSAQGINHLFPSAEGRFPDKTHCSATEEVLRQAAENPVVCPQRTGEASAIRIGGAASLARDHLAVPRQRRGSSRGGAN
jgi:hypothetical protein